MEKILSTRDWAAVKRIAQVVQPDVERKKRIVSKIQKLTEEYRTIQEIIDSQNAGLMAKYGLAASQLCHREVNEVAGKFDKEGRPVKVTTWEPNPNVHYDAGRNVYVVYNHCEDSAATTPKEVTPTFEETVPNIIPDDASETPEEAPVVKESEPEAVPDDLPEALEEAPVAEEPEPEAVPEGPSVPEFDPFN